MIVICGSFTLGRLFGFISTHFWFNGALLLVFDKLILWESVKLISVWVLLT
jgi:hypothetical protein